MDYNYIKLGVQESLRPPETLARLSERRQCGGLHVLTPRHQAEVGGSP